MIAAIPRAACCLLLLVAASTVPARAAVAPTVQRALAASSAKDDGPQRVRRITVAELSTALRSSSPPVVIDVREPAEFDGPLGHIRGARLIPLGELPGRLNDLESYLHAPIVTVCLSGVRSADAAAYLASMGFDNVRSLDGGMHAWSVAGMPVERTASR